MLASVEFDDEPLRGTSKIGDTISDGVLPPEFQLWKAFAKRAPQYSFDIGRIGAQLAR